MPALPLHPHPSAAPPAAAALPFELACEDGPPTAEDFADALNVAKNAALDVLVLALSGRTNEGLPTRDALFAAARILAHSEHHDRLAAARRPSALRARQHAAGTAYPPQMRAPSWILPREGEVSPTATEGATAFPTSPPRTIPPALSRTPSPAPAASGTLPQLKAIERTSACQRREHQRTAASPTQPPLPPPSSELLSGHPRPTLRGEEARAQHEQVRGALNKLPQDPPRPPPSPSHIRPPASQIQLPPFDFDPCDFLELDELLVHGPAP